MKAYEIVGWVWSGDTYCPDHDPRQQYPECHEIDCTPIFAGDEGLEDAICNVCQCKLLED